MNDRRHPSLQINIELISKQAQRIQNWVQARIGEMFFMMEVVYTQHPQMQEAINKEQEKIIGKLDQLIKLLKDRASELHTQIPSDKYYFDGGTPKVITLNCTTPQSQCCVPLLIHFDQLMLMYEQLWLLQLLTRKEAINAFKQWTLVVSETLHDCHQLYLRLQNQIKNQSKKS